MGHDLKKCDLDHLDLDHDPNEENSGNNNTTANRVAPDPSMSMPVDADAGVSKRLQTHDFLSKLNKSSFTFF